MCLDELVMHNSGVASQARTIRQLMEANNVPDESLKDPALDINAALPESFDFTYFGNSEPMVTPQSWTTPTELSGFPTFETTSQDMDLLFGFMDASGQQLPGF